MPKITINNKEIEFKNGIFGQNSVNINYRECTVVV